MQAAAAATLVAVQQARLLGLIPSEPQTILFKPQQPAMLRTIGCLSPTTASVENQRVAAFVQRLRAAGWIEGRTVAIKVRWAEGRSERAADIVAEFVRQ